jgi:hypothetical protein
VPRRSVIALALIALALVAAGAAGGWALSQRTHRQQALAAQAELAFRQADAAARTGDYNTARNSYLAVASSPSPLRPEARARLFDLTFAVGARAEAAHHLTKLEALVGPHDPRVHTRRTLLASPAPR